MREKLPIRKIVDSNHVEYTKKGSNYDPATFEHHEDYET